MIFLKSNMTCNLALISKQKDIIIICYVHEIVRTSLNLEEGEEAREAA